MKDYFPSWMNRTYALAFLPLALMLLHSLAISFVGYNDLFTIIFNTGKIYGFEAFIDSMLLYIFIILVTPEGWIAVISLFILTLFYVIKRIVYHITGEFYISDIGRIIFIALAAAPTLVSIIAALRIL